MIAAIELAKQLRDAETRIAELEAENKRILGSHDAYADLYENEHLDRKAAEALVDDLENQTAELMAGMDQVEVDAERRGMMRARDIAMAIDSGRGNEDEIARAIESAATEGE